MTVKSRQKPLVVLEIANNHMGDIQHGLQLIDTLSKATSPFEKYFKFAIKFQFRELQTFIHPNYRGSDLKFVKRFEETELSEKNWAKLISAGRQKGFAIIVTPFDELSVKKCEAYGVDVIKIASCSLGDWPLIERIALTERPVIFSTAGANVEAIDAMVSFFLNRNIEASLMHCVGLYPTPDKHLNIGQISFFKNRYPHMEIGYSTHENPSLTDTGALAYALGARVFEKHVGLETGHVKNNAYSATADQLVSWLDSTSKALITIGLNNKKVKNTSVEVASLKDLQRGAFLKHKVNKGDTISLKDVFFAIPSSADGLVANDFSKYVQITATKNIKPHEELTIKNSKFLDFRKQIRKIVEKIRKFLNERKVSFPEGKHLEISHHYGLENFNKTGLSMTTIINEEYCKKLLFLLPGQSHPEQHHKEKKETFFIIDGSIRLFLDDIEHELKSGDSITINPGVRHSFNTKIGCIIEELSTNHRSNDSFYSDKAIDKNHNRKTIVNFWQ